MAAPSSTQRLTDRPGRTQPAAPPSAAALAAWRQRWQGLAARERRALLVAATVLGLALLWLLALAPALRSLRELPAQQAELDRQLAEVQSLADETRRLRALPAVDPGSHRAALDAVATRLGALAQLSWQGDRALLRLQPMPGTEWLALLAELRATARARIVEAQMQQAGEGQWQGTLTLSLPEGAP